MLELNKDNFEQEVLQAQGKIFVDYFAPTCEPCKALLPTVEAFAAKYGKQLKFVKLDTSQARRLAIGQKILGLPVVAIYQNGEKLEELVKDDATQDNIEAMIKRHI
jgi:thioredoxin 1